MWAAELIKASAASLLGQPCRRAALAYLMPQVRNTPTEAIIPGRFRVVTHRVGKRRPALSELPPEVISDVIGFYKFMGHLERVFESYARLTERSQAWRIASRR